MRFNQLRLSDDAAWNADFADLLATIRGRSEEFRRQRFISADIIERLKTIGMYRAAVPRRFGGNEESPATILKMVEALSWADGSAGWVASFASFIIYLAALPIATLEVLYANGPDIVCAGGLFPVQPVRRCDGGILVNGRWKFGSGCHGAEWIGVGISVEEPGLAAEVGKPRMILLPAERVEIADNWHVIGLSGTGSNDLIVRNQVQSEDWSFVRGGPPNLDEPIFRFPALAFSALNHAAVGLGVARASLDALVDFLAHESADGKAPDLSGAMRIDAAKAEASLLSARAFFYDEVETTWQAVLRGDEVRIAQVSRLRLAANHAARVSVDVAQTSHSLAYSLDERLPGQLQHRFCDTLVVAQHAFLNEAHFESAGGVLFGMKPAPGYP